MIRNDDLQAWLTLFPDDQQFEFDEVISTEHKIKPTSNYYPIYIYKNHGKETKFPVLRAIDG